MSEFLSLPGFEPWPPRPPSQLYSVHDKGSVSQNFRPPIFLNQKTPPWHHITRLKKFRELFHFCKNDLLQNSEIRIFFHGILALGNHLLLNYFLFISCTVYHRVNNCQEQGLADMRISLASTRAPLLLVFCNCIAMQGLL